MAVKTLAAFLCLYLLLAQSFADRVVAKDESATTKRLADGGVLLVKETERPDLAASEAKRKIRPAHPERTGHLPKMASVFQTSIEIEERGKRREVWSRTYGVIRGEQPAWRLTVLAADVLDGRLLVVRREQDVVTMDVVDVTIPKQVASIELWHQFGPVRRPAVSAEIVGEVLQTSLIRLMVREGGLDKAVEFEVGKLLAGATTQQAVRDGRR